MTDWDPETYPRLIREEIPDYELLQGKLIEATRGLAMESILELGVGSGETTRRLLDEHPHARVEGIDSSEQMLSAARVALDGRSVALHLRRLEDALPPGPYDLVVSALAIHHLPGPAKADLFGRVARELRPGGRFVVADVVVPDDPADVVTPIEPGYDFPSRVDDQLRWLEHAGLNPELFWARRDLAVLVAER